MNPTSQWEETAQWIRLLKLWMMSQTAFATGVDQSAPSVGRRVSGRVLDFQRLSPLFQKLVWIALRDDLLCSFNQHLLLAHGGPESTPVTLSASPGWTQSGEVAERQAGPPTCHVRACMQLSLARRRQSCSFASPVSCPVLHTGSRDFALDFPHVHIHWPWPCPLCLLASPLQPCLLPGHSHSLW